MSKAYNLDKLPIDTINIAPTPTQEAIAYMSLLVHGTAEGKELGYQGIISIATRLEALEAEKNKENNNANNN